ncbi:MAG: membrane or secreted protein [Schleiferiaceae bacterium]
MKLILVAAALLGLGLLGMAVKIWGKKDGEFAGTCASKSPFLNKEGEPCSFCGALPEQQCQKES